MAVEPLSLGDRIAAGSGSEVAGLLELLDDAIVVRDRDGHIVFANRAALEIFGSDSPTELAATPIEDLVARFRLRDAAGDPVGADALPGVRTLATGEVAGPLLVQSTERRTGRLRWHELRAGPLRDAAGDLVAVATVIEDVTAVRTAEIHTRILDESGRALSASLDYEQTLRNVAAAALPGLADWCLVELVEDGVRTHVVVAHVDDEQRSLAERLRTLEPAAPTAESMLRRVLGSQRPELVHEVSEEHLRRVAVSDAQLDVYRRLGIRSALVVPMIGPTRLIGAISFLTSVSGRRIQPEDVSLAEQLARRAAVAVENARRHTTIEEIAGTLQDSLLPAPVPAVRGWEIGALYRPALDEPRIEVGGDFYEVFDTAGNAFAVIGDVTGHGIHAATVTTLLRHGARFASHLEPDPVAIVRRLDEELRRRDDGAMATTLCAALHDHGVLLCSAGHPPALVADAAGRVVEAPATGPLLGAFPDSVWQQQRVPVPDGGIVLLYTDGVTETVGDRDRYGVERLAAFLSRHAGRGPQAVLEALDAELAAFRGGPSSDDVAALALRPRAG